LGFSWDSQLNNYLAMNANTRQLLTTPLAQLTFSNDFVKLADKMGFRTLLNILATDYSLLIKYKEFSYLWFAEMVDFFHDREIFYLLDNGEDY
jgi:hypothetical protein